MMLRRLTRVSGITPARWGRSHGVRSLRVNAAVNAHDDAKTAVNDCLERVLGPGAEPASAFGVVFFEGHDEAGVQDALNTFAERRPQAPPVVGCGLGESTYEQQRKRSKQQQSARRLALASAPPSGKPGHKLLPWSPTSSSPEDLSTQDSSDSSRSPKIVTVLGLGFESIGPEDQDQDQSLDRNGDGDGDGGRRARVEALPLYADGGCFPNILGKDSVARIFGLPEDEQPLFFMLSKDDQSVPASDLQDTNRRLGNLLPNCTRFCALSSGDPSSVVSSFPTAGDAPVRGVCLVGVMSLQEQAGLARKTLGAFGFNAITVSGDVCDELFVPSHPHPPSQASRSSGSTRVKPSSSSSLQGDGEKNTLEKVKEQLRILSLKERKERQERRWREQEQEQEQQLGVFKVDEVVFPGMTRRFRIFEPRYRALVKQCLAEDRPLVILPLSRGGNTVATAARVTGLYNVEEDGRCEVEVTGIARCNVKTMWMKGESFGLFEAVIELFGDEEEQGKDTQGLGLGIAGVAAETSGRGDEVSGEGVEVREEAGESECEGQGGEGLVTELPELERLRIEVSAIMQKELYRTRTQGRSPLWPGWDGSVSQNDAYAAFTVAPPLPLPLPSPDMAIETAGDGDSNITASGGAGAGGGGGGDTRARTSVDGVTSIGGVDPCDLDAEALSYWAAQNVEAGALMKQEWLSSTSTTERLRGVRDLCRFALARSRDRSGVDSTVLSRPLSALRDLTSR
eukprot:g17292.t2